MKKKLVTMMLVLGMLGSSLAGCGSTGGEEEKDADSSQASEKRSESSQAAGAESQAADDEIPVDYFAGTELNIAVCKYTSDTAESFNDKVAIQMAEEATGIHINWIEVDQAVQSERITVMLASDEQPDAYLGLIGNSTLVTNASLFYDLSQEGLLETYAPNVLRTYDEMVADGVDIYSMLTLTDGSIRSLFTNSSVSPNSDAGDMWMVNQEWLDQLGLKAPTAEEEFYEVLVAFRDNDMNGNGIADEIPMSFNGNYQFSGFANAYGIGGGNYYGNNYMIKDGVVVSTVDTDAYRAFLEFYHKLYQEGLLDPEGFSQTTEQYNAKIAENKVGFWTGWNIQEGEGFNTVAFIPYQGIEGVDVVKSGTDGYFWGKLTGFAPTASCSNIEALLHWWNYLNSSTEMKVTCYTGEEGYGWHKNEDGKILFAPAEGVEIDHSTYTAGQQLGNNNSPGRSASEWPLIEGKRAEMAAIMKDYLIDAKDDIMPRLVDPLKVEEREFITTDLDEYINSFMANSVLNGVTDESWEEYLENLKSYQYYEVVQWWQDYYDRAF